MQDYNFLQTKYTVNTYVNRGLTFTRGEGPYLYDPDGVAYLDLMTNYGVNIFGYHHPQLTQTIHHQADQLLTLHGSFTSDTRALASETLIKKCGEPYTQVYWSNSGAEAVEAAVKFAMLTTNKHHLIACSNGYHGKSLGALSVTHNHKYRDPFSQVLPHTSFVSYGDSAAIAAAITSDTAAIIVEPFQGEGGIHPAPVNYLQDLRTLCDQKNILLILDEIQCGLGRTGSFLVSQASSIAGDILCLGKGLAGGLPVGATIITEKVAGHLTKGIHTSTFGGNPISCSLVIETLNLIDQNTLQNISTVGELLLSGLRNISSPNIQAVRGQGLMIGIEVLAHRNQLIKTLQQNQILVAPAGESVIRLLPPYILTPQHVQHFLDIFTKALKELPANSQ